MQTTYYSLKIITKFSLKPLIFLAKLNITNIELKQQIFSEFCSRKYLTSISVEVCGIYPSILKLARPFKVDFTGNCRMTKIISKVHKIRYFKRLE